MQLKLVAAGLALSFGCEGRKLADDLLVSVADQGEVLVVNLECEPCMPSVRVGMHFDPNAYLTDDDEIVIEQFRIDYDLAGVSRTVPYFAGVLQQSVRPMDDASFVVQVIGTAQRAHLLEVSPDDDVHGRATLTFAGYDSDDQQAIVETELAIRFAHSAVSDTGTAP